MNNEKIVNGLNVLLSKNYDSERGYETAAEQAKDPMLKAFFRQHSSKRYSFGHEIKELISECGGKPEKGTTALGDIHNAWLNFKTAFSFDKNEAVLEAVETGEEACLKDYNDFLHMDGVPPSVNRVITRQRDQVARTLQKVDALEDKLD